MCWRCDKELPKPKPQKKRNAQQNAQIWLYVIVAVFLVLTLMQTCGVKLPFGTQAPTKAPGGQSEPGCPTALVTPARAESAMSAQVATVF